MIKWAPYDCHRTKTRPCGFIWSLQKKFGKFHFWTILKIQIKKVQKWNFPNFFCKLQMKPQGRVFVLWQSYGARFIRNYPKFSSLIKSKIFSKFFTHKIEHDFYDTITGRYDINMTHITKTMSYSEFNQNK